MDALNPLYKEITEIGEMPIVPKILELICQTTGMRFAAMAKVTAAQWTALAVVDKLDYGVKPGDAFATHDTLCSDVRLTEKPVVFDDAQMDPHYRNHPILEQSGFRSHISVPIMRGDNTFYGTLCAIDTEPHEVNNERVTSLFIFLSDLISQHLDTVDLLKSSDIDLKKQLKISDSLEVVIHARTAELKKNIRELARSNEELKSFSHIASHDLQEPLRKIQTFLSMFRRQDEKALSGKGIAYLEKIDDAVERMRRLINDLLAYSVIQTAPAVYESVDLNASVQYAVETLSEEIEKRKAKIEIGPLCDIKALPYQIQQLFQNLIGNALKYSDPDRAPVVMVASETVQGSKAAAHLDPDLNYCKITVRDNGIGFDQQYARKIFDIFERLHGKGDYSGTGIGLSIVRKIVENHRGFISVKSEVGLGSEFTIYLPQ